MSFPLQPLFDYQALDASGKTVDGQVAARNEREAQRLLESRNLVPVSLVASTARPKAKSTTLFQRGPTPRQDALLVQQLALLLCAGIPLLDAVSSLRGQALHPDYVGALANIERRLRSGEPFAPSLTAAFPKFPGYLAQLAAAGEETGRLGPALQDGVIQMNYDLDVRQDIRNALTYPAILVLTGITAVIFIFIVVVPRFATMLKGKMDQLPFISRFVIELGLALNNSKVLILFIAGLSAVAAFYLLRNATFQSKLRDWLDRVPLIGEWLLEAELARWASMLSTMLANGVDLIRGLEFARLSTSLSRLSQKLGHIAKLVRTGQSLSAAIASQDIFTPTAISLIQVGEASGELDTLLKSMAELYANSGRQRMKRFLILLEPIAILLIGGVIGGIVAAIMLAITSVNQVAL
jgi:general secretion pathway protein F